jgi:hypothetical protein
MEKNEATLAVNQYGNLLAMPGYQVYEYQLILVIPDAIKDKLKKQRRQFFDSVNLPVTGSGAVFLPLVKFKQRQLLEQKLRFALSQLITGWRPFQVHLKDYAAQPSHALFIPVTDRTKLCDCTRSLKNLQQMMRLDKESSAFFPSEHQFVLASRLKPGVFEKAWQLYAHRHFSAQFLADAALLLKRKPGDLHWQITQRFEFKNLPVGAVQASLFSV